MWSSLMTMTRRYGVLPLLLLLCVLLLFFFFLFVVVVVCPSSIPAQHLLSRPHDVGERSLLTRVVALNDPHFRSSYWYDRFRCRLLLLRHPPLMLLFSRVLVLHVAAVVQVRGVARAGPPNPRARRHDGDGKATEGVACVRGPALPLYKVMPVL